MKPFTQVCRLTKQGLLWPTCLAISWSCFLVLGFTQLLVYKNIPAPVTNAPTHLSNIPLVRESKNPTLIMTVHPHCPCTRASFMELATIVARCNKKVNSIILVYKPKESSPDWEKTDIWYSATAIPNVQLVSDQDGRIAATLNTTTSGHVLLYDTKGHLQFNGGITASRSHVGANPGSEAVINIINNDNSNNRPCSIKRTYVFGCPIIDSTQNKSGEKTLCQK